MKPTQIMIRYGELSTKGKNISFFIDKLGSNVKNALTGSFPKVEVSWFRDRMYVELNGEPSEEVIERLKDIFGMEANIHQINEEKIYIEYLNTIKIK